MTRVLRNADLRGGICENRGLFYRLSLPNPQWHKVIPNAKQRDLAKIQLNGQSTSGHGKNNSVNPRWPKAIRVIRVPFF